MRRAIAWAMIASVAMTMTPAAATPGPLPILPRVGSWVVNYDDDGCSLAGAFGDDAHRLIARLTWFGQSDAFQLILIGKRLPTVGTTSAVSIDFGPQINPWRTEAILGTNHTLPMLMISGVRTDDLHPEDDDVDPPPITMQQEAAVAYVDVRAGSSRVRLDLPSFGKAMAAIHRCQHDLVKTWGLDPDVQAALSRKTKPINAPGTWLNSSDFPTGALFAGHNGIVRFRLDVSDAGAVTGCHVQMAMKPADFEKVTCGLVKRRARLSPALDSNGKPVASYYINSVHWVAG